MQNFYGLMGFSLEIVAASKLKGEIVTFNLQTLEYGTRELSMGINMRRIDLAPRIGVGYFFGDHPKGLAIELLYEYGIRQMDDNMDSLFHRTFYGGLIYNF